MLQLCFVVGLLLAIIGLARTRAGFRDLESNPALTGLGLLKAARFCNIAGIVLGTAQAVLWCIYVIIYLVTMAADPTSVGL